MVSSGMLHRVATWRNIPEDTILQSNRRESLKPYIMKNVVFCDTMMPCGSCYRSENIIFHCCPLRGCELSKHLRKQRFVCYNPTVTDIHDNRDTVARGSLPRPSLGASSLRTKRYQSIFTLKMETMFLRNIGS
jgi:hypothetical protein